MIDDLASIYDAYEGIQATAGMDIKRLKESVGDRLSLWGGIWHEHIILGGAEDIRNDARYAFSHAAPGGGYIMGSTHSLAVDAKRENILEMKRCRDEWGSYPIDPETVRVEARRNHGKHGPQGRGKNRFPLSASKRRASLRAWAIGRIY